MSLFGSKRRRPPNSQQSKSNTAHSDAATAALSAFSSLHHRQSSPSLSAAAAATALKARPHTPTDVSSVVPRRRSRRAGSANSSRGTASPHPSLRRSLSSGSMGERTFRSPSPHGRQPQGGTGTNGSSLAHVADYEAAPPVPSIPADVQSLTASKEEKQSQRPGTVRISAAPLRVASQKLKDSDHGTWFGSPAVGDLKNIRTDYQLASAAAHQPQDPIARPESRTSVNFSYPARQRVGSPPATPLAEEAPPYPLQPRKQTIASDTDHNEPVRTKGKRASATMSPPPRQATPRQRPSSMPNSQELVYDPNSRRMVSKGELLALEQMLNGGDAKQAPKQRKPTRAGSHLAKGTVGRTQVAAAPNARRGATPASVPSTSKAVVTDQTAAQLSNPTLAPVSVISASPADHERDVAARDDTAEARPRSRHYVQPGKDRMIKSADPRPEVTTEQKKPCSPPSTVEIYAQGRIQSPSAVQQDDPSSTIISHTQPEQPRTAPNLLDSVISRQHVYARPERSSLPSTLDEPQPKIQLFPPSSSQEPPRKGANGEETGAGMAVPVDSPSVNAEKLRSLSASPARVAHFGPIQRNLSVRHSPPPRSVSPRKSALKHYSSPRDGSPRGVSSADDASETGAAILPGEAPIQRKKSARVSFDDRDVVLDDSDSSEAALPQDVPPVGTKTTPTRNRRHWFSNIGRSKRKDDADFDEDEVMKPRPELPSFGSVRGEKKKHAEEVERPLVTPSESTYSPSLLDSPSVQSLQASLVNNDQRGDAPLGQSTDRAIATVIASDYASRFPANTSRYREPLPPVVTSREGGSLSMSSESSSESDLESLREDTPTLSTQHSVATTVPDVELDHVGTKLVTVPEKSVDVSILASNQAVENSSRLSDITAVETANSSLIPSIAITEASVHASQKADHVKETYEVPGGFPKEDESISAEPEPTTACSTEKDTHRSILSEIITEPVVRSMDESKTNHMPATTAATTSPVLDDSDSDGTSIYSDAYEDLSDIEENGFQSLDAVVDSPINASGIKSVSQSTEASPKPTSEAEAIDSLNHAPRPRVDDWETAKAYWRSLTADKRAQLEKEAKEEAGADADLEQEAGDETKKPRRKKSVEKRQAEKQAILEAQRDPERRYMIKPGTKAPDDISLLSNKVLRTSMRQQAQEDVAPVPTGTNGRLRKSMRANIPPTDASVQAPVQQLRKQNVSAQPCTLTTKAAAGVAHRVHNGHTAANSTAATSPPRSGSMTSFFPPAVKRRGSTSSESSFRRTTTRRATDGSSTGASGGGGFSMRRTMRLPAVEQLENPPDNQRISLRSFSPLDSSRASHVAPPPPISMHSSRMRSSLRDTGNKSKTGAKSGGGSISLPSFRLKTKIRGRNSGSRFGDSSDDEDVGDGGFRSRFEDSSDEEAAAAASKPVTGGLAAKTMRPGRNGAAAFRGLERPQTVEEESADLPDSSSDDELTNGGAGAAVPNASSVAAMRPTRQASSTTNVSQLQGSRSGRGSIGAAPALGTCLMRTGSPANSLPSSPTNRRGSFMAAVLGCRKTSAPSSPIQRGELMDSAARRDTALERSPAELAAMRNSSAGPKLQRRTTAPMERAVGEWPLASPPANEQRQIGSRRLERPSSAGNLLNGGGSQRPGIMKMSRRSTLQGDLIVGTVGDEGVVMVHDDKVDEVVPAVERDTMPPKPKKKKFGTLRRMFRLDD